MLHALNLPGSNTLTIYLQEERLLKAAEVTIGSASSKVVSPIMDKMESLPLEWIEGYIKCGIYLLYAICIKTFKIKLRTNYFLFR